MTRQLMKFTVYGLVFGVLISFLYYIAAPTLSRADERLPVRAVLCHPSSGIQSWSFERSYNSRNGRPDRTGMVRVRLNEATDDLGRRYRTVLSIPVPGLTWDADFAVIGTATAACREDTCHLEGRVRMIEPSEEECFGGPTYLFDGTLVVEE